VRPTAVPSYLCFAGQALVAAEVEIAPAGSFRAADLAATGRRALAFGVIVAMGLFSLSFLVALRERVFAWYFGYLCVFLLYLAAETRAAQRLPLLSHFGPLAMVRLSGVAIDIASALAIFFALDFIQLRRRMPRLARALKAIAWVLLPLGAAHGIAHLAGQAGLVRATIHVSNLLVAAGGLGLLVGGILSTARGSRYAAFFLVGWTPLVIAASAASIQQFARSRTASATLDWMLFAGAFESVVLSLGLADRTLAYRRELDRARELADRDALSGLLNRRALLRLSEALAADSRRWGSTLSVVMFDLDHFKQVNDVRGHAAGDVCIQQFAEHLTSEARASDFVARYGGEEFAVILPGSTPGAALAFAERVRLRVETHPVDFEGAAIPLTVSAGVATGRSRDSVESLLAYADQALYRAKRGGRNRVDVWGPRAVAGA
jgi:diguanylate cyclase (GGDEF)-like protein